MGRRPPAAAAPHSARRRQSAPSARPAAARPPCSALPPQQGAIRHATEHFPASVPCTSGEHGCGSGSACHAACMRMLATPHARTSGGRAAVVLHDGDETVLSARAVPRLRAALRHPAGQDPARSACSTLAAGMHPSKHKTALLQAFRAGLCPLHLHARPGRWGLHIHATSPKRNEASSQPNGGCAAR